VFQEYGFVIKDMFGKKMGISMFYLGLVDLWGGMKTIER
jgi:hypothetical protein